MDYQNHIASTDELIRSHNGTWDGISGESVARMRLQNRFKTGLDIARYTAKIMREDMAAYDADPANYTQSLVAGTASSRSKSLSRSRSISARPSVVTSICRAGWLPRCAAILARCLTSRCTKRPAFRH